MKNFKKGDIAIIAGGTYTSKPRPVMITQGNYNEDFNSIIVIPITTKFYEHDSRIKVIPTENNGLKSESYLEIEKIVAVPKKWISRIIGYIDLNSLTSSDEQLSIVLKLGGN